VFVHMFRLVCSQPEKGDAFQKALSPQSGASPFGRSLYHANEGQVLVTRSLLVRSITRSSHTFRLPRKSPPLSAIFVIMSSSSSGSCGDGGHWKQQQPVDLEFGHTLILLSFFSSFCWCCCWCMHNFEPMHFRRSLSDIFCNRFTTLANVLRAALDAHLRPSHHFHLQSTFQTNLEQKLNYVRPTNHCSIYSKAKHKLLFALNATFFLFLSLSLSLSLSLFEECLFVFDSTLFPRIPSVDRHLAFSPPPLQIPSSLTTRTRS
jgi:hypothetical protein